MLKSKRPSLNRNGIIIEMGGVEAVAIYDEFENSHVAHVKQTVVSKYPTKKFDSRLSSGLFKPEEGSYKEYESTRHTLVKVPSELKSDDEASLTAVQDQLNSFTGIIQRVVSHKLSDVLTEGDEWAIENVEEVTVEALEERYETRDSDGNRYSSGKLRVSVADGVVDDILPKEFSRRVYQNSFVEDVDHREGAISTEQTEDADQSVATLSA